MAKRLMKRKATAKRDVDMTPPFEGKIVPAMKITAADAKYMGYEPDYSDGIDNNARKEIMVSDFNWYSRQYGTKEAQAFIMSWLKANKREDEHKVFKKVPDFAYPLGVGWMCRMHMRGWPLNDDEMKMINDGIAAALARIPKKVEIVEEKAKPKGPTIQDRMREKAAETGGELEGLLDDYIAAGVPSKHDIKPISTLKAANILPQHVSDMVEHWQRAAAEFREAHAGKDADLKEGYGQFSRLQLRKLAEFAELVASDLQSYVAFKKAAKAPRKRKQKSPEQLAAKLKYLRTFEDGKLKLTSVKPAKIVGAKEMFAYSTKKRKLMYFVADEHAGNALTVRNNLIEGWDANKSIQKTVRKPQEQLKAFMAASKPSSRKLFKETKSVEQKFSGRFADDIVILKVW